MARPAIVSPVALTDNSIRESAVGPDKEEDGGSDVESGRRARTRGERGGAKKRRQSRNGWPRRGTRSKTRKKDRAMGDAVEREPRIRLSCPFSLIPPPTLVPPSFLPLPSQLHKSDTPSDYPASINCWWSISSSTSSSRQPQPWLDYLRAGKESYRSRVAAEHTNRSK